MSMNAEFVQVDENELARIRSNPSLVEALFQEPPASTATPGNMPQMTPAMQEQVRTLGPQVFANAMARLNPELRKALEERTGITIESFAEGKGGNVLMRMMEERSARAAEMTSMAGPRKRLSLDKNWHGLHYLLCGHAEPDGTLLGQAILGGTDLEDEEGFSGYGPARSLSPEQVKNISAELDRPAASSEATARFDAAKMNSLGIYPGFRQSDSEELTNAYDQLRDFFADAAQADKAIVTCLV